MITLLPKVAAQSNRKWLKSISQVLMSTPYLWLLKRTQGSTTVHQRHLTVFRYVEKENLVKPTDKAKVILDDALCDALHKGAVKKGSAYPTEIYNDLGSTFLNRMQIHHRVARGNEVVICEGAMQTVQIMTERRQGNKTTTRLSGLKCFSIGY